MLLPALAQGVTELPPNVWQVVAQSGFNAILILILLYYGRLDLALIRNSNEKNISEIKSSNDRNFSELRKSQDRATKMITLALLQIASVPGLKQQLESLKTELDVAERDDQNKP